MCGVRPVKYGFVGPSGQFYPLADDPITAQIALQDQGIDGARMVARDMTTDDGDGLFDL